MTCNASTQMKTVIVLGGAYGGARAIRVLSEGLPKDWRIVLVDRNTHINHVYVFPRLAVLPDHEHKGFIPFDKVLDLKRANDLYLHAHVKSVHPTHVVLDKSFPDKGISTPQLHFDYLVYALGSKLPAPLDLWGSHPRSGYHTPKPVLHPYAGTKREGIAWLKAHQQVIRDSASVLVVGGGALGIQFATDISAIYRGKTITLLHSRKRLLPRFDEKMHTEILDSLLASNVQLILGERLDTNSCSDEAIKFNEQGQRVVRTVQGRKIAADLILLCTGQKPNTHFLSEMDPLCVNSHDGLAHVLRTMQLGVLSSPPSPSPSPSPRPIPSLETCSESPSPEQELKAALAEVALTGEPAGESGLGTDDEEQDQKLELESTSSDKELFTPYPNIFVIGDSADAFGAIPAGHTAYYQAEVAARNILRLIQRQRLHRKAGADLPLLPTKEAQAQYDDEKSDIANEPLEHYQPGLPAIKLSLGLTKSAYQTNGIVGTSNDGVPDLNAAAIWGYFGYSVKSDEDMRV